MAEKRTELSDLGEFGLIDRIAEGIERQHSSSVLGIGDDAAVMDRGEEYSLLSTDMLVEGIHFDLSYAPIQHLGYKAVAVNVSDIAAMNVQSIMLWANFSCRKGKMFFMKQFEI